MAGKIKKASDLMLEWINNTREFCNNHGLQVECSKIEDMDWPLNWHLSRGGNGGKPYWWFNYRAVKDNFLYLWESRSISERPENWEDPHRKYEAIDEYMKTDEGKIWFSKNKPDWLGTLVQAQIQLQPLPSLNSITIHLSTEQKEKLQKFADEYGVDTQTLVRIWVLERVFLPSP